MFKEVEGRADVEIILGLQVLIPVVLEEHQVTTIYRPPVNLNLSLKDPVAWAAKNDVVRPKDDALGAH